MKRTPVLLFCWLALLAATLAAPAAARSSSRPQQEDRREVALTYVRYLSAGEFEPAGLLLTSDALYEDATARAVSGRARRFEGRAAILAAFQRARIGSTTTEVEVEEAFASGDDLVLLLRYRSTGDAGVIGRGTTAVASSFRALALLTFRGARIARHADHVDYGAMLSGLGAADATGPTTSATRGAAERYVGALFAGDVDAAAALLAPDVRLDLRAADGSGQRLTGRDQVLAGLRTASPVAGATTIRDGFATGELAVLVLSAGTAAEGETAPAAGVVVIEVRDGLVRLHLGRSRTESPPGGTGG
jgi:ketosteroid isomerase-like protein